MAIEVIKIPAQGKEDKVYEIRGKRVMIDRDLAECFGVETKRLNEQVRRNGELFSSKVMFKISKEDLSWSQIATMKDGKGKNINYLPNAFTEEGVRLLAQVLKRQVEVCFEPEIIEPEIIEESWNKGTVVLYQPNKEVSLEVRILDETVWLTQDQMAQLFQSSRTNIVEHIKHIYDVFELRESSTCRKFRQVQKEGRRIVSRKIPIYNLDMIISVGYRVNTERGINFRQWANKILKDYILRGYCFNTNLQYSEQRIDTKLLEHDKRLDAVEEKIDFFVKTNLPPVQGIFYDGQVYDAHLFVCDLVRKATKSVVLIDNYVDESILALLDKSSDGVTAKIITGRLPETFRHDLERHDAQYAPIEIERNSRIHDRFICIDDTVYHIGASIKDLGKKLFAFSRMELKTEELLSHISHSQL